MVHEHENNKLNYYNKPTVEYCKTQWNRMKQNNQELQKSENTIFTTLDNNLSDKPLMHAMTYDLMDCMI